MHRTTYTLVGINLGKRKDVFSDEFQEYAHGVPGEKFSLILDYASGKNSYFGIKIGESGDYSDGEPSEHIMFDREMLNEIYTKARLLFGPGEYKVMIHHFDRCM